MSPKAFRILAAICALLCLLALWDGLRSGPVERSDRLFAELDTASVRALVVHEGDSSYRIERGDEGCWFVESKGRLPVDDALFAQRLEVLPLLRSHRRGDERVETGRRIEVELRDGATHELALGENAGERYRWLRLDGGQSMLVEAHLVEELMDTWEPLLDRRLLRSGLSLAKAVSLTWRGQTIQLSPATGTVAFGNDARSHRMDPARARDYLESLRDFHVAAFAPDVSCPDAEALEIRQDPGLTRLRFCTTGDAGPGTPELGARLDGLGVILELGSQERLLRPFDEPTYLVERALLPPLHGKSELRIHCEGREESRLQASELDQQSLASWWRELRDAGGELEPLPEERSQLCELVVGDWTLNLWRAGDRLLAGRAGESWAAAVEPGILERLQVSPDAFADPQLISEEAVYASRIDIGEGSRELSLVRGELMESWSANGLEPLQASEHALQLRAVLASLRLSRVLDEAEREVRRKGSPRRILVHFDDALAEGERRYELTVYSGSDEGCLVELEGGPGGLADSETCTALLRPF